MITTGEFLGALNLAGASVVAGIAITGSWRRSLRERETRGDTYLGSHRLAANDAPSHAGLGSWPNSR